MGIAQNIFNLKNSFAKQNFLFRLIPSPTIRNTPTRPVVRRPAAAAQPQIGAVLSRDGKCQLQILAQPEQQHRARYQTEGSRGAVKDRSGNGFPIVKLTGYTKPTVLEVRKFICFFLRESILL